MKTIDDKAKKETLKKILVSKVFIESDIHKELLSYLIDASIKNKIPKALSIAIDVISKGKPVETVDEAVTRVYIHRLRQKLSAYYKDEGKHEKVRITIPKGKYSVQYTRKTQTVIRSYKFVPILIILILTVISVILFLENNAFRNQNSNIIDTSLFIEDPIWSDIFSSDLPTLIVLGDELLYEEIIDDKYEDLVLVKNFKINTQTNLLNFKSQHPDHKIIQKTTWPFFADNSIDGLLNILPLFSVSGLNYSVLKSSSMEIRVNIRQNNIMFLGGYRTLYYFRDILESKSLNLKILPQFNVGLNSTEKDSNNIFFWKKPPFALAYDDYCLFIKIPGPNGNCLMFFTSYHGIGIKKATEYTTNISTLKEFENIIISKNKYIPKYFITVFEVWGLHGVPNKIDVKYFEEIDSDINLWQGID